MEERAIKGSSQNNDIVYIRIKLNGVLAEAMIDTGANVSIIDQLELDRITELTTERIPTLPINNLTIIGATGKQNKTIRKQEMCIRDSLYILSIKDKHKNSHTFYI